MPHPIYGPVEHRLGRVEFVLELPCRANDYHARLQAIGYASTKRSSLWSMSESWRHDAKLTDLESVDTMHHVALVALQDRPSSHAALELGLRGGASYDPTSPMF